jgi:DNA-binding NarL/FixJ family response regulator
VADDAVTGPGLLVAEAAEGLLERELELAAIEGLLDAALSGDGGLLVIEGPPGIGKSRLIAAARARARSRGLTVLSSLGSKLEQDASFAVAYELFAPKLMNASFAERERLLAGHAALATSVVDPQVGAVDVADPGALARGLYWLTVNLALESDGGPPNGLLIAVDDAQWADRPSLGFLAFLAARIAELPVALVVAVRSGEEPAAEGMLEWLHRGTGAGLLRPATLSREAITEMVTAAMPGAEPAFAHACADATGGNPFLANELVYTLRADGIVPTAGSASQVVGLVPESVMHAVLVRVARLGDGAQRLATAVAVLGDGCALRHAAQLAELDSGNAERVADALAGAHILAPGGPLRFTHPLIAGAVAAEQPAFARARAHRAAADLLAADQAPIETIAAHLLLSTPDSDEWVLDVLRQAAGRAGARGDHGAAVRLLTRALAEPPTTQQRPRILLELADAEMVRGDKVAGRHIAQALELLGAGREAERVDALHSLARLHFMAGEHEAAADAMHPVLARLVPGDPSLEPVLAQYLALTTFRASLHPIAAARLEPIMEAARAGREPEDPGLLAHLTLRMALAGVPAERVRALAERATASNPLIDSGTHGILTGMVVQALACADELECAQRITQAALHEAHRSGSLLAFSIASFHGAIVRYHRGQLLDALADLDASRGASREGWTDGDPWSGSLEAHVHLERGDVAAAGAALERTGGDASGDAMGHAVVLFARARLLLADHQPHDSLRTALQAGRELADGFGIDQPGFVPWRSTAALAARALGDTHQAATLAEAELKLAVAPRSRAVALRALAAVSDGRRIDLLEQAVDLLQTSHSALQRGHALVDLGAARRRSGQRTGAQAALRDGLQLADEMGATILADFARQELHATGARPRRAASTGADALTPSERRVAELAASGLTNPQIAQALFVSPKTIQTHLAHTYRKLGIGSRRQLAGAAGLRHS